MDEEPKGNKPNGSGKTDGATAQRSGQLGLISAEFLPRMQAAWWKMQAAAARIELDQRLLDTAQAELRQVTDQVNETHGVLIGTVHRWVIDTGQIFEEPTTRR